MAKQSKSLPDAAVVESVLRTGWRVVGPLDGEPTVRERRANESGQSSVWRTDHVEKKAGVLKVARGPTQVARVRREIAILRRIPHPAIVPIVDADVECEPPWLITAQGRPLVEVWDPTLMSNDDRFLRAQRMILHLADGLDLAHKNDVVHRDIKPENVVLMRPDADDSAALIDFGIAHDAQAVRLTEAGGRAVANQFAAPPEAYYGPMANPPPWWDCLGLAWLWGWLISDEGREPKGGRYHWKYQPLMPHPRSESVRALIAACSNERTAPESISGFLELARNLGIGAKPTGAQRVRTAFTEAANQHTAALAAKLLAENQRREEVSSCSGALRHLRTRRSRSRSDRARRECSRGQGSRRRDVREHLDLRSVERPR